VPNVLKSARLELLKYSGPVIGLYMGRFTCFISYYYLADTEICPYMSDIKFKLWLHHNVEVLHEIGFTKLRMFLSIIFEQIIVSL
jgi:hypothetical protein